MSLSGRRRPAEDGEAVQRLDGELVDWCWKRDWESGELSGQQRVGKRTTKHNEHDSLGPLSGGGEWDIKDKLGGEFDPGSGSTLAACLMHASRTWLLWECAWRTGEEHVGNLPFGGG